MFLGKKCFRLKMIIVMEEAELALICQLYQLYLSNPIWGSDFFRVYVFPRIYVVYHVVVISLLVYSLRRLVGRILICLNVTA